MRVGTYPVMVPNDSLLSNRSIHHLRKRVSQSFNGEKQYLSSAHTRGYLTVSWFHFFFSFPLKIGEHQLILTTTCFKWLETTNLMFVKGDFLLSMVNQHETTPFGEYSLCFPTAKQANTITYLILQEPKQIYPAFSCLEKKLESRA